MLQPAPAASARHGQPVGRLPELVYGCSASQASPPLPLPLLQWVVYTPQGSFECICDAEAYAANIRWGKNAGWLAGGLAGGQQ